MRPAVQADRYLPTVPRHQVTCALHKGASSSVFLARHDETGVQAALRVFDDANVDGRRRALVHAARVVHPHVARVLEIGTTAFAGRRRAWVLQEYVEGSSLRVLLDQGQRLDAPRVQRLAVQAAWALAAAHARGVLHRDLRPEHLVLRAVPGGGDHLTVLDLGLHAPLATGPLAVVGDVPHRAAPYTAPERFRGRSATPVSDLYALGVVLYEALTGRRPFHGASAAALANAHLHDPPDPVGEHAPVSDALADVIHRLLRKDPAARFQSAQDVLDALISVGPDGARRTRPRIDKRESSHTPIAPLGGRAHLSEPSDPTPFSGGRLHGANDQRVPTPSGELVEVRALGISGLAVIDLLERALVNLEGKAAVLHVQSDAPDFPIELEIWAQQTLSTLVALDRADGCYTAILGVNGSTGEVAR